MSKAAKIGAWGGSGGTERDVQVKPTRLVSMTIRSGDVIDAISFNYVGSDNVEHTAGPWGGTGGADHKIYLDTTNYVTDISGTIGTFRGHDIITSLTIVTLKQNPRTYGKANDGTPFSIPVHDGGQIIGFFGRSGEQLDAIGLYVNP